MSTARRVVEAAPGLRWHLARARGPLYRRAFAGFGPGSVIVAPLALRGVERITVGAGCAIYERVWLQAEAGGSITLGDRVYVGHDVHLHSIDPVGVGSDTVLADGVFVASTDHDRSDRSRVHGTGPVHIGDRVFLGQRAVVLGGVTIGDGATVGAGAVVTRDVPAGATVAGVPARPVGSRR
ncbi:acyltransferase [Phycicoccus flavus]|uniref:acyltransferase n=1 Tax=Phycicoccus flavus TaxID=2502783 RepID=UPI000FEBF4E7|nr:acyltransferase [Phycicoccus flavus]NHA68780.1 acyltransferase [Phycicoccus flavus]